MPAVADSLNDQPRRPSGRFALRRHYGVQLAGAAVLALIGVLAGCDSFPPNTPDKPDIPAPPQAQAPDYAEVAAGYNANAGRIDRLWARAVVISRWTDEDGGTHAEQGEGHFMFIKPSRVALSAGKLGKTLFWAGANDELFYIFNLTSDPKKVYYGRYADLGALRMSQIVLPVAPADLLMLVGVNPLPVAEPAGGHVEHFAGGKLLVETPDRRWRLLIDPKTHLPERIDMLDAAGQSVLTCRLADFDRIDVAAALGPFMATSIHIQAVGEDGELDLRLNAMTDARDTNRLRDMAFDFDALVRALQPDEQVELKPQ